MASHHFVDVDPPPAAPDAAPGPRRLDEEAWPYFFAHWLTAARMSRDVVQDASCAVETMALGHNNYLSLVLVDDEDVIFLSWNKDKIGEVGRKVKGHCSIKSRKG